MSCCTSPRSQILSPNRIERLEAKRSNSSSCILNVAARVALHGAPAKPRMSFPQDSTDLDENVILKKAWYKPHDQQDKIDLNVVGAAVGNTKSFQLACANGNLAIARLLIESGCVDVSADEDLALRLAIQNGHGPVVRMLLGRLKMLARFHHRDSTIARGLYYSFLDVHHKSQNLHLETIATTIVFGNTRRIIYRS